MADFIGHCEEKGLTAHASKGGIDDRQLAGQAKGGPPDLRRDAIGCGVAGLTPRLILTLSLGRAQKL